MALVDPEFLKEMTEIFLSFIHSTLVDNQQFWHRIHLKLENRLQFCSEKAKLQSGAYEVPATAFDVLLEAYSGNKKAADFLRHIDATALEISKHFQEAYQNKIQAILQGILDGFNLDQSNYLDRVAELSVIQKFIENEAFEIVSLEKPLSNGKRSDLELRNRRSGDNLFLEIFSIHLKADKIETPDDLRKLLSHRISKKHIAKNSDNLTSDERHKLHYAIVIWPDISKLTKQFDAVFEEFSIAKNFILSYIQEHNFETQKTYYTFSTASDVANRWSKAASPSVSP